MNKSKNEKIKHRLYGSNGKAMLIARKAIKEYYGESNITFESFMSTPYSFCIEFKKKMFFGLFNTYYTVWIDAGTMKLDEIKRFIF